MRLIDADAAYKAACEGADNWDGAYSPYRYDRIREEMDKVPTFSPWHRVEEPPKNTGHYLTCYVNGDIALNWWNDKWGWMFETETVSYWMPIPEPPKEVQDGK